MRPSRMRPWGHLCWMRPSKKFVVGKFLYIVTLLFGMWFHTKICPEATNAGRGHSGWGREATYAGWGHPKNLLWANFCTLSRYYFVCDFIQKIPPLFLNFSFAPSNALNFGSSKFVGGKFLYKNTILYSKVTTYKNLPLARVLVVRCDVSATADTGRGKKLYKNTR